MENFTKKRELVDFISDTLFLERDSVYRRLRGEVQFSLQEACIIAEKLSISIDEITQSIPLKSRPFQYKIIDYTNPDEIDYEMCNKYNVVMKELIEDSSSEIGIAAKLLPEGFYLEFEMIIKFHLFKWLYQYDIESSKKMEEIKIAQRLKEIYEERISLYQKIKTSNYIFHKDTFLNIAQDIQYFKELELISSEELSVLKKELLELLDMLELISKTGTNKAGNKMNLYISEIDFDTPFYYMSSARHSISAIRGFTMNDFVSTDKISFDYIKRYVQSLKRTSIQISESGEIPRRKFFLQQRRIIDSI